MTETTGFPGDDSPDIVTPQPSFTMDQVREEIARAVEQSLRVQADAHHAEMEALRGQLAGMAPATFVATHAGGPGTEIAPTWGLADQEAARAAAEA